MFSYHKSLELSKCRLIIFQNFDTGVGVGGGGLTRVLSDLR